MINNQQTISIGIPAYNEEKNIGNLLNSLLKQDLKTTIIKEIIVLSDGSTDETAEKVMEIKDKRIKLIQGKKRAGKSARLNELFSIFQGDSLLLLDADIVIYDENLLEKLMSRLSSNFGIVSIKVTPLRPRNLFESILNFSVRFLNEIELKWNGGDNYLAYKGVFLLLNKNFAKLIRIPVDLINNDGYIYFDAKRKGFLPQYFGDLTIFYQSPNSFNEHLSQSSRFQASKNELSKYFSQKIQKSYQIPKSLVLYILLKYLLINPFYFFGYIFVTVMTRIYTKETNSLWHISSSTKNMAVSLQDGQIEFSRIQKAYKNIVFNCAILLRRCMYFSLYFYDRYLLKNKTTIFILCYHSISEDTWRFSVDYNEFIRQIKYLKNDYEFISIEDLDMYINGKKNINKPSVLIAFDDGYKDLLSLRKDLKKMNISPILFLLSDSNHVNRNEIGTNREFLSKSEIFKLIKDGWTIGSHGATHSDFLTMDNNDLKHEIVDSKKSLEKELKKPILYFAYPKGRYTKEASSLTKKAGYKLGFSMDDGNLTYDKKFILPRVGVDRTHIFSEFKTIYSPSVIKVRGFLKRLGVLI